MPATALPVRYSVSGAQAMNLCAGMFGLLIIPEGDGGPILPDRPFEFVGWLAIEGNWQTRPGAADPIEATLDRTSRSTGLALPVDDGLVQDAGDVWAFNGAAVVDLDDVLALTASGDGFTVAVRFWRDGGSEPSDQSGSGPVASVMQLVGLSGESQDNPTTQLGVALVVVDPTADPMVLSLQTRPEGQSSPVTDNVVASATDVLPADPSIVVLRCKRIGPDAICSVFIDGAQVGSDVILEPALFDLTTLTLGDLIESDGAFTTAALWTRPLSDAEVAQATDLEALTVCDGIAGTDEPWLDANGLSLINPGWIVPLEEADGVLQNEGKRREVRGAHDYHARAYRLAWQNDDGGDLERVRQALERSRGGATPVRWRHPVDDEPGPTSEAPRWRIINGGISGSFQVTRSAGGSFARFFVDIEEQL